MLPLPIPASVYGLLLLAVALKFGVLKLDQVRETGLFLTGIFPLLFVPAAAGVMELGSQLMIFYCLLVPGDCADHSTGHGGHGHGRRNKCAGGKGAQKWLNFCSNAAAGACWPRWRPTPRASGSTARPARRCSIPF